MTAPTADIELVPTSFEYIGADQIRAMFKTKAGDVVTYIMRTKALVESVNMSTALINNCTAQVFRDLDVF
jgi:uncharacterized protein YkvS